MCCYQDEFPVPTPCLYLADQVKMEAVEESESSGDEGGSLYDSEGEDATGKRGLDGLPEDTRRKSRESKVS